MPWLLWKCWHWWQFWPTKPGNIIVKQQLNNLKSIRNSCSIFLDNSNFLFNDFILHPFISCIFTNADNSENYWLFISVAPCRRRSSSKSQIFSLHHRPPFQAGLVFPSVKSFFFLVSLRKKANCKNCKYCPSSLCPIGPMFYGLVFVQLQKMH